MQLAQIDQLISDRGYRFSFPQDIEAAYRAYRSNYRQRLSQALLAPTLLCYNVFLIVDYILLPQTFWLSAALHFFVVSPIIVLSTIGQRMRRKTWLAKGSAALGPLAMIVQVMAIYTVNANELAQHYQYLAILVLIFMNLLFRLEFADAVIASMFGVTVYIGALFVSHAPLPVLVIGIMAAGAASYLSLSGNRQMQRDARHSFLRRLQDRLRIEQAKTEAERDALTGLYNRRRLDALFQELAEKSPELPLAVLMIDVDHFKRFNDENGHLAGDMCLQQVADLLVRLVRRDCDLVVRFGGEEFLVLLTAALPDDALRIAERIRGEIEALGILHADGVTPVTASIGAMADTLLSSAPEDLLAGADAALYVAKTAGRNRVWPPDTPLDEPASAEGLEGDKRKGVRHAVENLQAFGDEMPDVAVV
ncbi:GGDEF domain-containing protein [Jiella sonneratiae]|uniref:diguanylate cyclase n=1 Tax=Jiella sonneratiae TaxID=2816856 RepID=A0ABS3J2V5_9HYPH|nr:diguanylate cyclase [Jiella sonneratiae]MBO0903994.1 diguanylate cyclase [Jiella sonneratiae]